MNRELKKFAAEIQSGQMQRSVFQEGSMVIGAIVGSDSDNLYTVRIPARAVSSLVCVNAVGLFAGVCGIRTSLKLAVGDSVAVLVGNPNYIIATLPSDSPDLNFYGSANVLGGDPVKEGEKRGPGTRHTLPVDLLEGEVEMGTLTRAVIRFLTNMVGLSAGDRAKVECFLQDGLLRLVSEKYQHFSALGEAESGNSGRPYFEFNGSSYTHELFGVEKKDSPKFDDGSAKLSPDDEMQDRDGRWRVSLLGMWLGDLLHGFITDPVEGIVQLSGGGGETRSGRAHIWTGSDGSVLVQSVADIVLERVVRIPVPVRKRPTTVEKEDLSAKLKELEGKFTELWTLKSSSDKLTCVYGLREYARWLSNYHAYARIKQLQDQWDLPTEQATPAPSPNQKEDDVDDAVAWIDTYATIRITRAGQIVLLDGSGSSITMAQDGVKIHSTRNLNIAAAGNLTLHAGGNLILGARRSVEITAEIGGFVLKCCAFLKTFCTKGSIWVKSSAKDPRAQKAANAQPAEAPTEADDDQIPPEILDHGVLIETEGRLGVRTKNTLEIVVNGSSYVPEAGDVGVPEGASEEVADKWNTTNGILVRSSGAVVLNSSKHVGVKATGAAIDGGSRIAIEAGEVFFETPKILFGVLATLKGGALYLHRVVCRGLRAFGALESTVGSISTIQPGDPPDELERQLPTSEDLEKIREALTRPMDKNQKVLETVNEWKFLGDPEYLIGGYSADDPMFFLSLSTTAVDTMETTQEEKDAGNILEWAMWSSSAGGGIDSPYPGTVRFKTFTSTSTPLGKAAGEASKPNNSAAVKDTSHRMYRLKFKPPEA